MKKSDKPSEYFVSAIRRGFDKAEAEPDGPVTCSMIWDHVIVECLRKGDFKNLFAWDTSIAQNKNRIGDIMECIRRGYVPGLRLVEDGRTFVERC